ncbi:hypothetical protein BDY24DRAFT_382443 [Mrakia frigida]|uniref:uncharacterized protein n=1 Tax=Mrakia frigida TaxID=29902 RepID=UPI003FCC1AE4
MGFLTRFFLASLVLLCIACALSGWILAAINLRKQRYWRGYSRIDPSFIIASIFAFFWYFVVLLVPAGVAIGITVFFACWFLAEAIAYTVLRWDFPSRCPHPGFPLPSGCIPIYKSLMAFSWIDFGLACILIGYLIYLTVRHSRKYHGESGSETMAWDLCDSKRVREREREQGNVIHEKSLPPGAEASQRTAAPGTTSEATQV